MAKTKLTKSEKAALLIVMRKELQTLFEELDLGIPDYDKVTQSIVDNLALLIKEGFKADPDDSDVYTLFDT